MAVATAIYAPLDDNALPGAAGKKGGVIAKAVGFKGAYSGS